MLDVSPSLSFMPSALAAASRSRSRSASSSSLRLLARTALSLISMTSVKTIGCAPLTKDFVLFALPIPPMLRCNDRIGVLRANEDRASDAATRMLPLLRAGVGND